MSKKLTIVAQIQAKLESVERVHAELMKLIPPTRQESGCVQYDLHQDNQDPAKFLFFEIWESPEQWQAHMENQHLKDFKAATEGAIEDLVVHQMTQVG